MNDLSYYIEQLICYALKSRLIEEEDKRLIRNQLIHLLKVKMPSDKGVVQCSDKISDIMEGLLDEAYKQQLFPHNNTTERDLFEAAVMGILTPRPTQIINQFRFTEAHLGIETATNWLYKLAKNLNYIQCARIAKNESWVYSSEYGDLEITINLSKPEKDPKEIAEALKYKSQEYPLCVLCAENEGFAGSLNQPARQNHRLIPLELLGEKWFFQYSPYLYYNEHCIVLSEEHRPMRIDLKAFKRLLEFSEQFPHYFIGSNADLPVVGGSILSHDHFQGGKHEFAMAKASVSHTIKSLSFSDLSIEILHWPMSVVRLSSANKEMIEAAAQQILSAWQQYSNEDLDILAFSGETPHNTITPIARRKKSVFQLDLVFRNNRTSQEYPMGIFHPHEHLHHLKKENIGLIEVMGLAILPGRLKQEILDIVHCAQTKENTDNYPHLHKHKHWIAELSSKKIALTEENIKSSIGRKFIEVLENAAVFKPTEDGRSAFIRFLEKALQT